mmetsp:Transcript_12038/g.38470  ORF Transcript_12038/g.38470 Transcript_12038/m.38470 type:complete len:176 (-) Transcript_12038:48-575(-)
MSSADEPASSVHDFVVSTIDGEEKPLGEFTRGKVSLIVNVASKCGFTPQYEGLQALYEEMKDRGVVICGFPSNEFGGQEPGSNEDIKEFACGRFNVTFPMFAKVNVNGADEHPLYNFLKHSKPGIFGTKGIKWNFTKFLVDADGKPVARYAPTTKPASIKKDIEKLLGAAETEGK